MNSHTRWMTGLGLAAAGVIGGMAIAAPHGLTGYFHRFSFEAGTATNTARHTSNVQRNSPNGAFSGFGGMRGGRSGGTRARFDGMMGNTQHAMGYVGSGGNGMMGQASGSVWTPAQVKALVHNSEQGVTINRATNTITYHQSHDLLVPLAAPASLHVKGMQWEIDGLINPKVVVPQGAQVKVALVNEDQGYMHGFEVTTAHPPFAEMAMAQGSVAFSGGFVMPILPETSQGQYHHRSTQFTASRIGSYYYICPVPGHAAQGMAGQFVVN